MAILITGVCGFIGSNLANYFIEKGERIAGIDNLSRGNLNNVKNIKNNKNFTFYELNICDYVTFLALLVDFE